MGVMFYADWCDSCQILDPVIEKACDKDDLDNESIVFSRLDMTDASARHQTEMIAQAIGIGDFYNKNGGCSGFMLLADAETKEIIGRITKTMDEKAMTSEPRKAIQTPSN